MNETRRNSQSVRSLVYPGSYLILHFPHLRKREHWDLLKPEAGLGTGTGMDTLIHRTVCRGNANSDL